MNKLEFGEAGWENLFSRDCQCAIFLLLPYQSGRGGTSFPLISNCTELQENVSQSCTSPVKTERHILGPGQSKLSSSGND